MYKRDKNFKLDKQTKIHLAFMPKEKRSDFKALMINAIIQGSIPVRSKKKDDKETNESA